MNKLITLSAILLVQFISQAKEYTAGVTVTEATVYLKGAKVVAITKITLVKGKNFIRLENLPREMNPNTISITVPKTIDLMSVSPELQTAKPYKAEFEDLRLLEQIKKNNRQIEVYNLQINMLTANKSKRNKKPTKKLHRKLRRTKSSDVERLEKLTAQYAKKAMVIDNALNSLNEKKQELTNQNKALNDQLAQGRSVSTKPLGYDVVLELDSKSDQSVELSLSYLVEQAGWIPSYSIYAKTDKKAVEIKYNGKIYQNTGQEWNNIKLSISSYKPNLNTQRPILHPMYVKENSQSIANYQTIQLSNSYQSTSLSPIANVGENNGALDANLAEPATWNAVVDSPLSVIYELNRKHTIPSKIEPQHVLLDIREVPADYVYHAVPLVSNEVHLLAKVKDWNQLNLMGGEAFLFLADNYVGKTVINSRYSTNELPIAMGTEERITVQRTRMADQSDTKKIKDEESGIQSYEITYKSNMTFDITLEILDQLPLSLSNRIVVSEAKYEDAELAQSTGALLWKRELQAGKSGKILFSYKIAHDRGLSLRFTN